MSDQIPREVVEVINEIAEKHGHFNITARSAMKALYSHLLSEGRIKGRDDEPSGRSLDESSVVTPHSSFGNNIEQNDTKCNGCGVDLLIDDCLCGGLTSSDALPGGAVK